jgi:hypothetical protein
MDECARVMFTWGWWFFLVEDRDIPILVGSDLLVLSFLVSRELQAGVENFI